MKGINDYEHMDKCDIPYSDYIIMWSVDLTRNASLQTQDVAQMYFWCWSSVVASGPTVNQRWFSVLLCDVESAEEHVDVTY